MSGYKYGVSAVALLISMGSAAAQQTGGASGAQAPFGEEIVVSGQRFQNSLVNRLPIDPQKLPFTLEVVDAAAIVERGFFNPFDILETLPNVFRRQTELLPGSGGYNIRGLTGTVLTNNRPESTSRGAGRRDISYIERIEVAKGPASILLGPVIPGGVINQVTKSPLEDDFVKLMVRGGSYGTHREEIDANFGAPFGADNLGFRITAAYENQQSPQDLEHTETIAVRPVFEADFSDRTRVQASIAYTERDSVPGSRFAVNADGSVPATIDEKTYFGLRSEQGGKDLYYDAEVQHEFLDNLKLVLRGSYQDADFDYQTGQGGYNYAGGRGFAAGDTLAYTYYSRGFRNQDTAYGDAQLVGDFQALGQRQDWVIGGSHRWEKFDNHWGFGGVLGTTDVNDLSTAAYITPDFGAIALSPFVDSSADLSSVYGETNIRPMERLTIVAGARYDKFKRRDFRRNQTSEDDDFTFRVGSTYELTNTLNAYVSYAESFVPQTGQVLRAGESYTDPNAVSDPIDPETATNYEIGLKGSVLNGRINLTAAAFMLTRQNVATADPNNVQGSPSYVVGTGEQEHNGFEVGAGVHLTESFNLNLSYGYVDAKITKVINPGNGQGVGDTVALTPSHTFSVYGTYTVPGGPLENLRVGLGARGISKRPAPRFGIEYEGYTLVDANISYPLNETFDVQVNVHNLFDKTYRETIGFDSGSPSGGHRFGNPLSAYVTLRATF